MAYYNWIDARDYSMECLLLFDRWALNGVFTDCSKLRWFPGKDRDYKHELAKAMYRYPYIYRYVAQKAPECMAFLRELQSIPGENWTEEGEEVIR